MLYARGSLGVVAVDDSLYAIGGFDAESALNVVEVLDTRAMQWRSLQILNAERSYGGATVVGGQVSRLFTLLCCLQPGDCCMPVDKCCTSVGQFCYTAICIEA